MFDKIKNIFNTNEDGRDGFKKWSKRILEISEFISKNNRLPKQNKHDKNEHNLYQSYSANRRKFYSKELSNKHLIFLRKHNIDFEELSSFSVRDGYTRWSNRIKEISAFISKNNRLPESNKNDKNEYNLYQSYCANKRKFYAKKLSPKQQRYLEQHNIIFENNISDRWKNKVLEIEDFIKSNGKNPKTHYAFKKSITDEDIYQHKLYHALARIRRAKEKGKLSDTQLEFLEQHNIILENNISNSDRWKNKVLEISDFIITNERYPKSRSKDISEEKLYHALARIRRAKEKGKLSDTQLEFLEQHNIILENNISNSDRWKNKVLEISDFIITNERYPKSRSKDISEEKLYHALARIRRAKEKGKLSNAQTDLLKKCSIIFENNAQLISLDTQDMEDITNLIKQNQILKASQLYLKCSYDSGIKDYKFIENSFEVLVEETLNV